MASAANIYPHGEQESRIIVQNLPLWWLYRIAYSSDSTYFTRNRILLEVEHPHAFASTARGAAYDAWLKNGHGYCYELVVPPEEREQLWQLMQQDLRNFFPEYQACVEVRKRAVLALVRTSSNDKIRSKGGTPHVDLNPAGAEMRNQPLHQLILPLSVNYLHHLSRPLLDQTGYTGKVDLQLHANLRKVADLRQALKQYDLDLLEREAEIEVLVIRDTGWNE